MTDQPLYTYASDEKQFSSALDNYTQSSFYTTDNNVRVRPPYERSDYERFRPSDALPQTDQEIMVACRYSYENVGIVRSVIDLMIEMAVDGLELVSDDESVSNFYRNWANRVDLVNRAESFAGYYLIEGNVAVRRKMGKIDSPEKRRMQRNLIQSETIEPGMVPLEYLFYNPSGISLIGNNLALFSGHKSWGIRVDFQILQNLRNLVVNKDDKYIKQIFANIPQEIRNIILDPGKYQINSSSYIIIPIADNRIYVDHYKKPDDKIWAKGIIYGILDYVLYNKKLRLAKISALDSFSKFVRLWKLGKVEDKIVPVGALEKLNGILQNHPGGPYEIIWDNLIEVEDHFPPVEKLENYHESNEEILLGLGINKSLIGGIDGTGSGAASFAGLRNIMKRINSTRKRVKRWVETEINIVGDNMGFRNRAMVQFKSNDLFDPNNYMKLMVELLDRNVISSDTVIREFGKNPAFESFLVENEYTSRTKSSEFPPKLSPYMQPMVPEENKDFQREMKKSEPEGNIKEKPDGNAGRPQGSKDRVKRSRRIQTVSSIIKGQKQIDNLDNILDKQFLVYKGLENKRQMTAKHKEELLNIKISILALSDGQSVESLDDIDRILNNEDNKLIVQFKNRANQEFLHCETDEERKTALALVHNEFFGDLDD